MTKREIANHILFGCAGDNCACCDWSDDDRATLEGMSYEEAQDMVDNATNLCLDCNADLANGYQSTDLNLCQPCKDYREQGDGYERPTSHDLSDDADALASAGWGTDEDYGGYGDD